MVDFEKYMIAEEYYIPIVFTYKRGDEPKLIIAALAALAIAFGVTKLRNISRQKKLDSSSPEYKDKLSKWGINTEIKDQIKNDQKINAAASKISIKISKTLENLKSDPKLKEFDTDISCQVWKNDTNGYVTYEIIATPNTEDAKKVIKNESFKSTLLAIVREQYSELFDTGLITIKASVNLGKLKIVLRPKYF